jgi:hypothetical protein
LDSCVFPLKPSKLFLAFDEESAQEAGAARIYAEMIQKIREGLPYTKLYLVCTNTPMHSSLNEALERLCDGKRVVRVLMPAPNPCKKIEYKQRFEILSSFFRNGRITMGDAFAIASL